MTLERGVILTFMPVHVEAQCNRRNLGGFRRREERRIRREWNRGRLGTPGSRDKRYSRVHVFRDKLLINVIRARNYFRCIRTLARASGRCHAGPNDRPRRRRRNPRYADMHIYKGPAFAERLWPGNRSLVAAKKRGEKREREGKKQ